MFGFFSKNKQNELINSNTLSDKAKDAKSRVENFMKFAKKNTDTRHAHFQTLMSFALESKQWTHGELVKKDDENDSALVFNFSQEYSDRYMARLFPRNAHTGVLEVGVKVTELDQKIKQAYEDEILKVYAESSLPGILLEQGIDYLVGGAGCLFYPQNRITKKADIISLDPTKVYLGWKNGVLVQFAFKEYLGDNKFKTIYYDLANIIVVDETTDKVISEKNPFNFIPFSWVPNNPLPHQHEGISKIRILSDLDRAYNRNASNFDKRIEENTDPHLLIKSDMADAKNIERGRNKKTRLGKDDDMKYLELQEGEEVINWLNLIEKRIKTKTGIINSSGDFASGVSGKSLSFQFADMMDLIGFMRLRWDKAFREMNSAILTYAKGEKPYVTHPVYQPFMAQDSSERVKEFATMIENDIISREDAIDELRGVENAGQKIDLILKENKRFAENEPQKEPIKKEE